MNRFHALVTMLSLALPLRGQAPATTLLALGQRAQTVVVATVLSAGDLTGDLRRVDLRTQLVLAGDPPATFSLVEPAGRCCGRGLGSLDVGQRWLLFLARRDGDLQILGGDRGVVLAEPAIVEHVRLLLGATNDLVRARLLGAALAGDIARLRADAAWALPALAQLRPDAQVHGQVLLALQGELAATSPLLPSLVDAALRTDPGDPAVTLLPLYLDATLPGPAAVLRLGLARLSAPQLLSALAPLPLATELARVRAAELLGSCPAPETLPLLDALLDANPTPRAGLAIVEALLGNGRTPDQLRARVPAAVLELARQRAAAGPTFRTLGRRHAP